MTPPASRPIARTSDSLKRAIMPCAVARITSSSPDETSTQASSSFSSSVIARMPVERTRSNCSSGVFLMIPRRVASTRYDPAANSGSVIVATGTSPASTWTPGMLMIGRPFAWREASGIAWTLAENTRPRFVKNSAQSCVLATRRCSTASSSRVTWPMIPFPPRCWRRYVATGWRLM